MIEAEAASRLTAGLRLPLIGAPMLIISNPTLVIAQCTSGIIGAFPALNARSSAELDEWLEEIAMALAAWTMQHPDKPAAPFAVNQIVHRDNRRIDNDLALCAEHRVPIMITSMGAREDVNHAVHAYGGLTLHDVTTPAFAEKALAKGADGLVAVCAGAGGHAGSISPFALVREIRSFFGGPLALSGAVSSGHAILAALALGADLAYAGTAFIPTSEANATQAHKQMIIDSCSTDIIMTDRVTGVPANFLRRSLDAVDAREVAESDMLLGLTDVRERKAWRDIWGAGQGVGSLNNIVSVRQRLARLEVEFAEAKAIIKRVIERTVNE